jgi:plasmid stability protein
MICLVIRNLEKSVIARLKRRAEHHSQSLDDEIREILRYAVDDEEPAGEGLGTLIARRFAGKGLDFEIPEWNNEFIAALNRSTGSRS